jgi:hypothetical protein
LQWTVYTILTYFKATPRILTKLSWRFGNKKSPKRGLFHEITVLGKGLVAATSTAATAAAATATTAAVRAAETAAVTAATTSAAAVAATAATTTAAAAVTTAAAAAAVAAATAATTTAAATEATATSAWWAGFHWASLVNYNGTAVELLAVHAFNSSQSLSVAGHFNKAEAF